MAIFRIVDGQKKLFANINTVESINGQLTEYGDQFGEKGERLEAGAIYTAPDGKQYKNIRLSADEIPFFHQYEDGQLDYYTIQGVPTTVRDKITELAIDLGNNWTQTKKNQKELGVLNPIIFLRYDPSKNYIPNDPKSGLHTADPELAALFDSNNLNFRLIKQWWLDMQSDPAAVGGEVCPYVFIGLQDRVFDIEETMVKSVNGQFPDTKDNNSVTINSGDILRVKEDEDAEDETVEESLAALELKTKISANDKVLVWRDNGLRSYINLVKEGTDVVLYGKREITEETTEDDEGNEVTTTTKSRIELGRVNMALGSSITYADTIVWTGSKWEIPGDAAEQAAIAAAAPKNVGTEKKVFLTLGFKLDDGTTNYTFSDLSDFIDIYTAGNGINIVENEVSVKIDPESTYELSVSEDGIKYTTKVLTKIEFDQVAESKRNDGVYYVVEENSSAIDKWDLQFFRTFDEMIASAGCDAAEVDQIETGMYSIKRSALPAVKEFESQKELNDFCNQDNGAMSLYGIINKETQKDFNFISYALNGTPVLNDKKQPTGAVDVVGKAGEGRACVINGKTLFRLPLGIASKGTDGNWKISEARSGARMKLFFYNGTQEKGQIVKTLYFGKLPVITLAKE